MNPKKMENFSMNATKGANGSIPAGKAKIAGAMRVLLEDKDFFSITTAEIAKTAGVSEALLYRYYGGKRGLLHSVLGLYLKETHEQITERLADIEGAVNRLKCIIRETIHIYNRHRVFAKIVLVEARNFPGFFESESYQQVRSYANLYSDTIKKGIEEGIFKNDISPRFIQNAIIGMLEHLVMPHVIFGRKMDPEMLAETIYAILFSGILKTK